MVLACVLALVPAESAVTTTSSTTFGLHGVALSRPFTAVVHDLHEWHGDSGLLAEQFDRPYKFTVRELDETHGVLEVRSLVQLGGEDGAVYFLNLYFHLGPDGDTHYLKNLQLRSHNFSAPGGTACRQRTNRVLDGGVREIAGDIEGLELTQHGLRRNIRGDGLTVNREHYLYTASAGDYPQPFRAPQGATFDYDELQIKSELRWSPEPGSAPGGGKLCRHELFLRFR